MAMGQEEAHGLLHGRAARGLPRAGAGPGEPVPHAHRAAPDRGARRSQTARRRRPVRPPVLLLELVAGAPAREPVARQGSAPVAQPVADLGGLRAPALLTAVTASSLRSDA